MKKIAARYAKALFQLAKTAAEKEEYYNDLGQVKNWMIGSSNFSTLLENPIIPRSVSHQTIAQICEKGKASTTLTHFLLHIVSQGRLRALPDIIEAYRDLYHAENNISKAEIETAHPLNETLKTSFKAFLEDRFNTKLIMNFKVNEALLGGFRTQVSSHQIDASLMTKLEILSRTLKEAS